MLHQYIGVFKVADLTALRDQRSNCCRAVDIDYRKKNLRKGQIIPIQNHVMLAIDGSEFSEDLVRPCTHRIAGRRNATWGVISIQSKG